MRHGTRTSRGASRRGLSGKGHSRTTWCCCLAQDLGLLGVNESPDVGLQTLLLGRDLGRLFLPCLVVSAGTLLRAPGLGSGSGLRGGLGSGSGGGLGGGPVSGDNVGELELDIEELLLCKRVLVQLEVPEVRGEGKVEDDRGVAKR